MIPLHRPRRRRGCPKRLPPDVELLRLYEAAGFHAHELARLFDVLPVTVQFALGRARKARRTAP